MAVNEQEMRLNSNTYTLEEFSFFLDMHYDMLKNSEINNMYIDMVSFFLKIFKNSKWENLVRRDLNFREEKFWLDSSTGMINLRVSNNFRVNSSKENPVDLKFMLKNSGWLGPLKGDWGKTELFFSYKVLEHTIIITLSSDMWMQISVRGDYQNEWNYTSKDTLFEISGDVGVNKCTVNIDEVLTAIKNNEFDKVINCDFQSLQRNNDGPQK